MNNKVKKAADEILRNNADKYRGMRANAIFRKELPLSDETLMDNAEFAVNILRKNGKDKMADFLEEEMNLPIDQVKNGYLRKTGKDVEGNEFEKRRDERMFKRSIEINREIRAMSH